jgi:hypothetical protein
MKKALKKISFLVLLMTPLFSFSQTEIKHDTLYFKNNEKDVMVVHTINRQYYNDSACVWEVSYPEIFNLGNKAIESSMNLLFSKEVSFGDCNDKVCDRATMYFPLLSRYWDKVVITSIKNDLLSFYLYEGNCPTYTKVCFIKTRHYLYNLKTGTEIEANSLFKTDAKTQHSLDSVILHKLDFVPEDMDAVRYERQFYFEKGKLMVFYDNYSLGRKDIYAFELSYEEIKKLMNPSGPLKTFFGEMKKTGK